MIHDAGQGSGLVLAEIYDGNATSVETSRLVNLSTRGTALTGGEILIGGLIINEGTPAKILIRGIGPGLVDFGVAGVLTDPQISLFSGSEQIAFNDDWDQIVNLAQLVGSMDEVGAFPLTSGSKDAAMIVYLDPGRYTVHLSGVGGLTGTALLEVYLLD